MTDFQSRSLFGVTGYADECCTVFAIPNAIQASHMTDFKADQCLGSLEMPLGRLVDCCSFKNRQVRFNRCLTAPLCSHTCLRCSRGTVQSGVGAEDVK